MYFPEDMNFQYFFFNTYIGYFLQALPIALMAGLIYGVIRFRKDKETPVSRKIFSCVFVCYLTGLVCLVIGLDLMGICYYKLFYHRDPGREFWWFDGAINLVPDFLHRISGEVVGNFMMFLPFGILYPLSQKNPTWKRSVLAGFLTVIAIEVLQPVFDRAFDINDIILNTLGILLSASGFLVAKRVSGKRAAAGKE